MVNWTVVVVGAGSAFPIYGFGRSNAIPWEYVIRRLTRLELRKQFTLPKHTHTMASPRVLVLRAPGTNCDLETAWIFDRCGGQSERVHLFRVLENPGLLADYQILCLPGGFSYGDDVGAGVIFGAQLRSHLADAIASFLSADKLALGICNGFQILMRSRILPGGIQTWPPQTDTTPEATLTWNVNGRYTCRWVKMTVPPSRSVFLRGISEIELPMAHAEGRVAVESSAVTDRWREQGQIALTYDSNDNPNGSVADIAGLCDPTGRVLGLMPHPERFVFATQHPMWTRSRTPVGPNDEGAGVKLFRNAIEYFG